MLSFYEEQCAQNRQVRARPHSQGHAATPARVAIGGSSCITMHAWLGARTSASAADRAFAALLPRPSGLKSLRPVVALTATGADALPTLRSAVRRLPPCSWLLGPRYVLLVYPERGRIGMGHAWLVALWIGVDVGGKRKGFDVAVIDDRRVLALQGRLACQQVVDLVVANPPRVVAIDSPRYCAPEGQTARAGELQLAKSICGIRWTPDMSRVHASAYYAWIIEGLALFDALAGCGVEVIEVFPTASWTRWLGKRGSRTRSAWTRQGLATLGLDGVPARTNQDQRDAIAAAMTARQQTL